MGDRSYVRSMLTHIAAKHLDMLFGENFFDFIFAVVRHALKRFLSAFNYNRLIESIPWYNSIGGFITKLESSPDFFLYQFDNHFLPMSDFVPSKCLIYKMEDGFDTIRKGLGEGIDAKLGTLNFEVKNSKVYNDTSSPIHYKSQIKLHFQPKVPKIEELSSKLKNRVYELYSDDYKRFGYGRLLIN